MQAQGYVDLRKNIRYACVVWVEEIVAKVGTQGRQDFENVNSMYPYLTLLLPYLYLPSHATHLLSYFTYHFLVLAILQEPTAHHHVKHLHISGPKISFLHLHSQFARFLSGDVYNTVEDFT